MTDLQDAYIQAYQFAASAHQGQTFPGTDLPYIMHLSDASPYLAQRLRHKIDQYSEFVS